MLLQYFAYMKFKTPNTKIGILQNGHIGTVFVCFSSIQQFSEAARCQFCSKADWIILPQVAAQGLFRFDLFCLVLEPSVPVAGMVFWMAYQCHGYHSQKQMLLKVGFMLLFGV